MKRMNCVIAGSALFVLVGCGATNDYTPPADATGESIFSTACTECHKPLSGNVAMLLSEDMANKESITKKFQSGSMRMPAFKNINGEAADRLAEYVLTHSDTNR
ncbi:MAG: c-type cytochrome [Nitrosomonas sp.]|nr:c-type cytochrome [Nitrosomonas sp.]